MQPVRIVYNQEDYEELYGKTDYTNKTVLDIGADWGSTADYFLRKGALQVIAVDNTPEYIEKMKGYIKQFDLAIIPLLQDNHEPESWSQLLETYKPDIVKSDCEGCEIGLLGVPNTIFRIPKVYIIETHSKKVVTLHQSILLKLKENGYEIVDINPWARESGTIITAKRIDEK